MVVKVEDLQLSACIFQHYHIWHSSIVWIPEYFESTILHGMILITHFVKA